jgi:hypothetical protein
MFVLSKEWTDVVNARGRVAVWLTMYFKVSPVPHPCSLSHYLIGNATISPHKKERITVEYSAWTKSLPKTRNQNLISQ